MMEELRDEDERRAGLVDFGKILGLAEVRAHGASDWDFRDNEKLPFARVWDALTSTMDAHSPAGDITVIDDRRAAELPERWARRGGERKKRRVEAKWSEVADRLAIPAWDMEATFSVGAGMADTYSRMEIPMYMGSNGVLYVGAGDPTPAGTHPGGSTFHTPDAIPEVWREQWGAWATIDNRHEVTVGFANLIVEHSLTIDL